jgi:hypothetical protein
MTFPTLRLRQVAIPALGLLAGMLFSNSLCAQGVSAITGSVTDANGGAIAGARIHLVSQATQFTYETVTNGQGEFVFPDLPIGTYQIKAESPGFQTYEQLGLPLQVGERTSLPIQLKVGQIAETVTVTAAAPLVNASDAQLSTVVDQQRMQDMPLNGRDPLQLMVLVAGAVPTAGTSIRQSFTYAQTFVSASGGRGNSTNFVLDGGDNNDLYTNVAQPFPNPDALAEFQYVTNNYSAEYGNAKGGVVNAVIRSGTNEYHGVAFEFLRNTDMNATNFFSPGRQDGLKRNQYGYTFGGPVRLPRYNGRNKTFFFTSFQDTRIRQAPTSALTYAPTVAERNGDFNGSGIPLTDPLTNAPFPNNQIPASRLSSVATNLMKFVPVPPSSGLIQFAKPTLSNEFQWIGKADHAINDNERLSFSFVYTNQNNLPFLDPANVFSATQGIAIEVPTANVTLTSTLRPTLINALHLSYSRMDTVYRGVYNSSLTFSALGVKQPDLNPGTLGTINVGASYYGGGFFKVNNGDFPSSEVANHTQLRDDLTWIKGRHELKAGGQIVYLQSGSTSDYLSGGSFAFSGNFSSSNLGDLFLGLPSSYTLENAYFDLWRQKYWSFYAQDKFRVTRKLTINMGLRWDPNIPATEHFNNELELFIPGRQSQRFSHAPLGELFPGDPGIPKAGVNSNMLDFAPRFGVAFDPKGDGRMAIRAGYGIFFDTPPWIVPQNLSERTPFINATTITTPKSFADPFQGQPAYDTTYVGSSKFIFPTGTYVGSYSSPLDFKMAYAQQWNLSVERQFEASTLVRLAYAGSKGTHTAVPLEGNPAVYGPGATVANINQRRPYGPGIGTIGLIQSSGNSSYNSFEATVEKRWVKSFSLLANYSWQKSLDYESNVLANGNLMFDPYDNRRSWGPSRWDVPQRFVTSALWALPQLSHTPQWMRQTLGGWQVNGIITIQGGLPLTVTSGMDNSFTGIGNDHADQILPNADLAGGRSKSQTLYQWFNTAAFKTNAVGTFGDTGRNILRGPGLGNVDASLMKYFSITERAKLQLRGEAFNFFNRANFANPDGVVKDPTFGRVLSAGAPRILQVALKLSW